MRTRVEDLFSVPLVDLGTTDRKYAGVFTPIPELGRPKIGVSEILLSGAEYYFQKFEQFSYIYGILEQAIERFNAPLSGLVVDIGSGFGNTVIPLLQKHPQLTVLATDISPDLLAICRREAINRGFGDRCMVVAMDNEQDYIKKGVADAVFGCAVLHHMVAPEGVVRTALDLLKPGGRAVFLEPFESGNSILRIAFTLILEEASRRGIDGPVFRQLATVARDIEVRTHRTDPAPPTSTWRQMDDKWLFTREHFEKIAREVGAAEVTIEPIHGTQDMFVNQTRVIIESYGNLPSTELPSWAWSIIQRFDSDFFSSEQKKGLPIEAMVTLARREGLGTAPVTRSSARTSVERKLASQQYGAAVRDQKGMAGITMYPDTWADHDSLSPDLAGSAGLPFEPRPYRPTFAMKTDTIDAQHYRIMTAPLGHQNIPVLIELGFTGFLMRAEAMKLYEMAYFSPGDLLEIGTHKGLSTSILASALAARHRGRLETVEIDSALSEIARDNVRNRPGFDRVTFTVSPATERLDELVAESRRFGFVFVDHWHAYEETADAIARLKTLLVPGGFVMFHDFLDPGNFDADHPYGVYEAVLDGICTDTDYLFCGNFGGSGLFSRRGESQLFDIQSRAAKC